LLCLRSWRHLSGSASDAPIITSQISHNYHATHENQLVNHTELGRDVSLPQPTVHRWLNLLVIEAGDKLLPIEVKATSRPRLAEAAHLRTFRQEYGKKSWPGLLLHTGSSLEWLAPDVLAAPWRKVL
jgi:hypothetical protein